MYVVRRYRSGDVPDTRYHDAWLFGESAGTGPTAAGLFEESDGEHVNISVSWKRAHFVLGRWTDVEDHP